MFSARGRAVVEDMALVAFAAHAMVFRAREHQLEVGFGRHCAGQRAEEAGPAGAAFELAAGGKQRQIATCTVGGHFGVRSCNQANASLQNLTPLTSDPH